MKIKDNGNVIININTSDIDKKIKKTKKGKKKKRNKIYSNKYGAVNKSQIPIAHNQSLHVERRDPGDTSKFEHLAQVNRDNNLLITNLQTQDQLRGHEQEATLARLMKTENQAQFFITDLYSKLNAWETEDKKPPAIGSTTPSINFTPTIDPTPTGKPLTNYAKRKNKKMDDALKNNKPYESDWERRKRLASERASALPLSNSSDVPTATSSLPNASGGTI